MMKKFLALALALAMALSMAACGSKPAAPAPAPAPAAPAAPAASGEAAPAAPSRSNDNDVTVMESRLSVVSLDWEAREAGQHAQNCIQGVLNKKMPHYAGINVIVTSSSQKPFILL